MQQEWDDLDRIILSSKKDIEPSYDYNEKLMSKINGDSNEDVVSASTQRLSHNRIAALSLILSGFLLMMILTTDFQYKIIEAQYELRAQVMVIQYEYKYRLNMLNRILGE